ncbi:MAG: hypothetical protein U0531_11455 [Dehalococcoidia bacterium]
MVDTKGTKIGTTVTLASQGGDPVAGAWKVYGIPLSALAVGNQVIGGVALQDETGKTPATLYVDHIGLR